MMPAGLAVLLLLGLPTTAIGSNLGDFGLQPASLVKPLPGSRESLNEEPQTSNYYFKLGLTQYKDKSYEEALSSFRSAFQLKGRERNSSVTWMQLYESLARTYAHLGRFKHADYYAHRASMDIRLSKADRSTLYIWIAEYYASAGDKPRALKCFKRAFNINPKPEIASQITNLTTLLNQNLVIDDRAYKLGRAERHQKKYFVFGKKSLLEIEVFEIYSKALSFERKADLGAAFACYEQALDVFRNTRRKRFDLEFCQFVASRYSRLLRSLNEEDLARNIEIEFFEKMPNTLR